MIAIKNADGEFFSVRIVLILFSAAEVVNGDAEVSRRAETPGEILFRILKGNLIYFLIIVDMSIYLAYN